MWKNFEQFAKKFNFLSEEQFTKLSTHQLFAYYRKQKWLEGFNRYSYGRGQPRKDARDLDADEVEFINDCNAYLASIKAVLGTRGHVEKRSHKGKQR